MTTIKNVHLMEWRPCENVHSFMCIVEYACGRRYKFYGHIPATVRRYLREKAWTSLPPCYGCRFCEAIKVSDLRAEEYPF